jgi:hypothetical protein
MGKKKKGKEAPQRLRGRVGKVKKNRGNERRGRKGGGKTKGD